MIAWNLLAFHVLETLPKGSTLDAENYRDNVPAALVSLHPDGGGRKLVIDADNARACPDQMCVPVRVENRPGLATHSPYSLDLAPSDFILFKHVKHCLPEMAFASHEELLTAIGEIVTDIPNGTLHHVFDH
jgi:hypothetical protein